MLEERKMGKTIAPQIIHNLILENRKKLSISGVEDVESFEEGSIVLYTQMGTLIIKGEQLHINKLNIDNGEISIEGGIDSCTYTDSDGRKNRGSGFFSRIFR